MAEVERGVLGLFGHPDDEQIMSGVLAAAAAKGIRTGLICATRGEVGQIADPSLATRDNLGHVREAEMRAACAVLGVKHLWFLDYRDSGMAGTPDNDNPESFAQADEEEALRKIVAIVRQFKPTVMVTFDETGGYGHPDHKRSHELATKAFTAAADPNLYPDAGEAWQISRLYYSAFPRSMMRRFREMLEQSDFETDMRDIDLENMGLDDSQITNVIDVNQWVPLKERSLHCHRTQLDPNNPMAQMPKETMDELRGKEYYALGAGVPLPEGEAARGNLLAGLQGSTSG